jgi:hypothetical protein
MTPILLNNNGNSGLMRPNPVPKQFDTGLGQFVSRLRKRFVGGIGSGYQRIKLNLPCQHHPNRLVNSQFISFSTLTRSSGLVK